MAYYPATTVNYATANTIWQSWNTVYYQTYATSASTNQLTWAAWNQGYQPVQQPPSAAQLEALRTATERSNAASAKAKELLIEHLSPAQRESYEKHGLFVVESSKKNRFQLSVNRQPRRLNKENKEIYSYCIHTYGVPRDDELLGFKLMLEANEDEFLRTANATALAA